MVVAAADHGAGHGSGRRDGVTPGLQGMIRRASDQNRDVPAVAPQEGGDPHRALVPAREPEEDRCPARVLRQDLLPVPLARWVGPLDQIAPDEDPQRDDPELGVLDLSKALPEDLQAMAFGKQAKRAAAGRPAFRLKSCQFQNRASLRRPGV